MNDHRLNWEHMLYLLILAAAVFTRLLLLGNQSPGDAEAAWALRAAGLTFPGSSVDPSNTLYLVVTSALFNLFSDSTFLARLWPALAGSALVLAPIFFRRWLGSRTALILAAGLALDPGLAALSRQAGSPAPALMALLLACGTWLGGSPRLAGFFAGLALLAGPALWPGLLAMAVAFLVSGAAGIRTEDDPTPQPELPEGFPSADPLTVREENSRVAAVPDAPRLNNKPALTKAGTAAAMTVVLLGTLFLTRPWGLGSAASSLPIYLATWTAGNGLGLIPFLMALPLYETLPCLFALPGIVRSIFRRDPLGRFLGLWLALTVILAVANPGRQPADWAWVLVPLWTLAAREINRHLRLPVEETIPTLVQFGMGLVVLAFISLSFAGLMDTYQLAPADTLVDNRQDLQWLVLGGALLLLVLTSYLIAWGWSAPASMRGLVWASLILLAVINGTQTSRSTGITLKNEAEIWMDSTRPQQTALMQASINDISRWNTGFPDRLEMVIVNMDSPSLRWALRHQENVTYTNSLAGLDNPPLILTSASDQPGLISAYRGQDFSLSMQADWPVSSAVEWLQWAVFRRLPQDAVQGILWVRSDLFLDGKTTTQAPILTP